MRLRWSAAHCAFGFPPWRQSANSKSGWRTGFEKETVPESRSVIVRTPHACSWAGAGERESAEQEQEQEQEQEEQVRKECELRRRGGREEGKEEGAHHQRARDVAPEGARAEEEAARARDALEVERGEDAPAHELEVQVDRLVCEPGERNTAQRNRTRQSVIGVHCRVR